MHSYPVSGAGLGFRRPFMKDLDEVLASGLDFMEVAPENWMGVGGKLGRIFRRLSERMPLVAHGLCLNLGGQRPIDHEFLKSLKAFIAEHGIRLYSDHLSYCADDGHLYDLMPIPFTDEAVRHVAARVSEVQDSLGQRIGIENVSYYGVPGAEMSELEFLCAVLDASDCWLHLDVNNVYVNSVNHGYDPRAFLDALPLDRICHAHIAGHWQKSENLIIDTHGAPVIDEVWSLLAHAYQHFGVFPTLIERDFDIPPFAELLPEVEQVRTIQAAAQGEQRAVA
jgi:uncharacterized protein